MEDVLLDVLHRLLLSDNQTRFQAEKDFEQVVFRNPSEAFLCLLKFSRNLELHFSLRQATLLNLKRIVPFFWSAGFQKFVGPAINQDVKAMVRTNLLELVTNDTDSKIRKVASYAVVQIAAVDYPDEWPDLLEILYTKMTSLNPASVLGGLSLLQELFDDLVTEEQFFEGGVGSTTISKCVELMTATNVNDEIKTAAAKLYKTCLLQLQSPEVMEHPQKKAAFEQHFQEIVSIITSMLQVQSNNIHSILLRITLYSIAYMLVTEFPVKLFPRAQKTILLEATIKDIILSSAVHLDLTLMSSEDNITGNADPSIDSTEVITDLVVEQFQFLTALNDIPFPEAALENFLEALVNCCYIPFDTMTDYLEEYNTFISEEVGATPSYTVRSSIMDYLSEVQPQLGNQILNWFTEKFSSIAEIDDWKPKEAIIFLLEGLMRNDNDLYFDESIKQLMDIIVNLLQVSTNTVYGEEALLRARVMLFLPHYAHNYKDRLANGVIKKLIQTSLTLSLHDLSGITNGSFLISLTYYDKFFDWNQLDITAQDEILRCVSSVIRTASEDTPPLLAEVLKITLKIHKKNLRVLRILIQLSDQYSQDVQFIADIEDVLDYLLEDVDQETYMVYVNGSFPSLLEKLNLESFEYSSKLVMVLQLFTIFIKYCPGETPRNYSIALNKALVNILSKTDDDQVLQLGGEAFTELIKKAPADIFNLNQLLEILQKFLSPRMSDSAALNLGSFVLAVVKKFKQQLSQIVPSILSAVIQRLIVAKELATIHDLLSVFCFMISEGPDPAIGFLKTMDIQKIFNIWFQNFQILRGEKIKENVHALIAAYLSNTEFDFTVDGDEVVDLNSDVIITRSMRKAQKFQQVSVPFKIIKLLLFELSTQSQQKGADGNPFALGNTRYDDEGDADDEIEGDDGDDEGWEDFEEIGDDFSKLQSYITDERGHEGADEEVRGLLVNFFKKIAAENIRDFQQMYNHLTEEERSTLTNNII